MIRMRIEGIGYKKEHPGYKNSGNFKKGTKPWNTGIHVENNDALRRWRESGGQPFFKNKKMPDWLRKKLSEAAIKRNGKNTPRGSKHWNWNGGRRELRKKIQQLRMYYDWRSSVFFRDNYTCQICGVRGVKIQADHIKPFSKIISQNSIKSVRQAKLCTELWDISNGRTLCVSCHQKTDTYGLKSIKLS